MTQSDSATHDGRDGPPFLVTLSSILLTAGGVLLLPRQIASAGIAFALGFALRVLHRRRQTADEPAHS